LSHAESVASSGNSLKNISDDILCLRKYPPVQEMIRYREGNKVNRDTNSTYQIWRERMQIIFSSMMGVKPYYMQLRYINEKGNERVRLDSDGTNRKIIPDSQLQNQAHRGEF
jgi:methyl-accepting chemotaxis protein